MVRIQPVYKCETQIRLDQDKIDEYREEAIENESLDTESLPPDNNNQSVSEDSNIKTTDKKHDKEKNPDRQPMIDLFYKDYEKLYGEKLKITGKELGCITQLLKEDKTIFDRKYKLLLEECQQKKNKFFTLTPSILLSCWNRLVEAKQETWNERMDRIKRGDLHYE